MRSKKIARHSLWGTLESREVSFTGLFCECQSRSWRVSHLSALKRDIYPKEKAHLWSPCVYVFVGMYWSLGPCFTYLNADRYAWNLRVSLVGRFLMYIQEASCWLRNVRFDGFHVPQPRPTCLDKFFGLFCRSFLFVSFDIYSSLVLYISVYNRPVYIAPTNMSRQIFRSLL